MSSPAPVVILAEDRRQARFVRAYLRNRFPSLDQREIFDAPMANGHGSGAQWVIDHYEAQVRAHLIRRAKRSNVGSPEKWLIAVVDADAATVKGRLNALRKRILASDDDRVRTCRVERENVARLIPRWSIETWILCLSGEAVDEITPYKSRNRAWDELIRPAAAVLHSWVSVSGDPSRHGVPSLQHGIAELKRLTA